MVPSHRRVGFAGADPALNPLASEALSFKEPALSFRYMDGTYLRIGLSPRRMRFTRKQSYGRGDPGQPCNAGCAN
jgi:hypothetical protein